MSNESFITRALDFFFTSRKSKNTPPSLQQSRSTEIKGMEEKMAADHTAADSSQQDQTVAGTYAPNVTTTNDPEIAQKLLFTPENIMHALGVEILENGGDGYYLVGFQGGVFVLSFEEDRLNVMYNDVMECSFADSVKASFVANEINSAYAVWSCYLRTSKRGSSGLPIKVCFSQMFPLQGNFKNTTEFIHGVMTSAFSVGREFRERFKKAQKETSNLANLLNQKDFVHKLDLAKRLMEVQNYEQIKEEMPPASYLRLDALADLFNETEFGEVQSLKILADLDLQQITDPQKVAEFDLRAYIRNLPDHETLDNLTLIATFEKQDLVISLKKLPGSSPKSLFFALNVMRSGVEDDIISHNRSMISCRDTIEIRLTTEQEDYWEVKYMIDEARDKHNKNDVSSLTDEQKMMLIQLAPNVQDDLYWGFKFFNQDCLFQALFYFKRIYYNYCVPAQLGKRNDVALADISLYIGIVYCQLKRYELAYYYLDKSHKYDSILASEWYTNCLCSLKDPGAFKYIKRMLDTVSQNMEEADIDPELRDDLYTYYLFLQRRLLQTLVTEMRLTEAEHIAKDMIANKENVEFCRKELDVIRRIRKIAEEQRHQAAQTDKSDPLDGSVTDSAESADHSSESDTDKPNIND